MSLEEYVKEKLWPILVETVHAMVMYAHHKAYTREVIIHEKPDITPQELAARLGIPLGEALVIIYELKAGNSLKVL
ncbi:MAG: hypothetical protein QW717_07660 [Candidatus Bathyarchaeia archaeon]